MDSAYRYGGEEFTVILPETVGKEAETVAHRIRSAVQSDTFEVGAGEIIAITISIGVTEYAPPEDIANFIQRADQAMYISKDNGRNRVSTLYAPDSETPLSNEVTAG
jgi:diguanylate cyclase (GGDEF)-like protein